MSDVSVDPSVVASILESAETVTVTIPSRHGSDPGEVEGRLVAPGLAATPSLDNPDRFSLTHIPSGLAVVVGQCAEHIEEGARLARESGIDWTRDAQTLAADPAVRDLAANAAFRCYGRCNPSTPLPPSWRVRCHTCDWEWYEDDDPGESLDAKAAKRMALEHDCEPEVTIAPPDGDTWFPPYMVKDDGTLPERARRG